MREYQNRANPLRDWVSIIQYELEFWEEEVENERAI
jgi:hypothetical protein